MTNSSIRGNYQLPELIGRSREIALLNAHYRDNAASLVVLKGRRRIGKSRLAEEFSKGLGTKTLFLTFSGIPPEEKPEQKVSAQDQRDAFARQLAKQIGLPEFSFKDWADGFRHLDRAIATAFESKQKKEGVVVLLDEISWMGMKDPTFVPKLKEYWDSTLRQYKKICLILCGSVSTWIEKNIINSTAMFGRVSLILTLNELALNHALELLKQRQFNGSTYEQLLLLGMCGGVPWYLEQISPRQNGLDNIKRLAFSRDGLLVDEFERIFNDLFVKRGTIYRKIIAVLAQGMRSLSEIRSSLNYSSGGALGEMLVALQTAGFVTQHLQWKIGGTKTKRASLYRLSDNFLRFHLRLIHPAYQEIKAGIFERKNLLDLPAWNAHMGLLVENLILKNSLLLLDSAMISAQDIVCQGPYRQSGTKSQPGCQIDYLVQTRTNTLYLFECKFSKSPIKPEVIEEVKDKIRALRVPKGFAIVPILVALPSASDSLELENYFYKIIDSETLQAV